MKLTKVYTKARARSYALKSNDPKKLYYWRDFRHYKLTKKNAHKDSGLLCGVFRGGGQSLWMRLTRSFNTTGNRFHDEVGILVRGSRATDPHETIADIVRSGTREFTWAKDEKEATLIKLLAGDDHLVRNF